MRAIFHEYPNGFGFSLSHEDRIVVATAHADERTDRCEYPSELVRVLPSERKCTDAAGAATGHGTIVRVFRKDNGPAIKCLVSLDFREDFIEQEPAEITVKAVELEATVEPRIFGPASRAHCSGGDTNRDRDRHLVLVDEIVKD